MKRREKNAPLVDDNFLLERYPGKGGWTYASVPQIQPDRSAPFGWVKVRGTVDGVEIKKYHLMPQGNGNLFLPVKSEIRKKIKKEAGDLIHVVLYHDDEPLELPAEFIECLQQEPGAFKAFQSLPENEQLQHLKWAYGAKTDATKAARIADIINKMTR